MMPNGVPNSSFLEYRFPILTEESSTRFEMPSWRSLEPTVRIKGLKRGSFERGTIRTLVGATGGGKERT